MTTTATIDYTTWRKGRCTEKGETIDICPKCGRKGAIHLQHDPSVGYATPLIVQHTGTWVGGIFMSSDHCVLRALRPEAQPAPGEPA